MKLKNLLFSISLIAVAILFIFSGLSKSINPFGFSNQIGDYFAAVGVSIGTMCAMILAVAVCGVEILLGLLLLTRIHLKKVAFVSLLTMVFFTALTTWIAIANPVSDCGCFGEVIKISNIQTLLKNICILPLTVIIFRYAKEFQAPARGSNWLIMLGLALISVFPSFYFATTLPLIDSTPYKVGVNIPEALSGKTDQMTNNEEVILQYKNRQTEEIHDFALSDTTWYDDTKWEYVATLDGVTEFGGEVNGLSTRPEMPMIMGGGKDISDIVLSGPLPLMIIVSPTMDYLDNEDLHKLKISHLNKGGRVILLTSGSLVEVPMAVEAFNSDNTTLKTIIQNYQGGVMLLENGVITHKWSMQEIPNVSPILE